MPGSQYPGRQTKVFRVVQVYQRDPKVHRHTRRPFAGQPSTRPTLVSINQPTHARPSSASRLSIVTLTVPRSSTLPRHLLVFPLGSMFIVSHRASRHLHTYPLAHVSLSFPSLLPTSLYLTFVLSSYYTHALFSYTYIPYQPSSQKATVDSLCTPQLSQYFTAVCIVCAVRH